MSETPAPPATDPAPQRRFDDLTLAELLGAFRHAPRQTLGVLIQIARETPTHTRENNAHRPAALILPPAPTTHDDAAEKRGLAHYLTTHRLAIMRLGIYTLAIIVVWLGNLILVPRRGDLPLRIDFVPFSASLPFLVVGLGMLVIGEAGIARERRRQIGTTAEADDALQPDEPPAPISAENRLQGVRWSALVMGVGLAVLTYALNGGNRFSLPGVMAWVASVALIVVAFLPARARRTNAPFGQSVRAFLREHRMIAIALVVITLFGAYARFLGLDISPPEMTSDHIEKLLDAQAVREGRFDVFFRGNGGREPMQMYLIALLASVPGFEVNFWNMKVVAALEGIVTVPVMWWLGVTLLSGGLAGGTDDPRRRRTAYVFGLCVALMIAVAYWHIAVGRVSLRIILTPLVTALLLIFLIRAMRHNRRADYVWAGLVLGVGLYTYQAVRMLPLVAIAAVALALVFYARTWAHRRVYVVNFIALVAVSFAVFTPMFRFSVEYPQDFWRRSTGRLLGDEFIEIIQPDGTAVTRVATAEERAQAFLSNLGILGQNMVDALLMFNYRGDIIYLHNVSNYPAMTPLMAALMIVGAGGWLVRLARRRDAADGLILVALLLMLLPSALSIASPNENPSHTRTSGAMPSAYLLVGYGLFCLIAYARQATPHAARGAVGIGIALVIGVGIHNTDSGLILNEYRQNYINSWKPLSDGGRFLRGFAESDGAFGNAFMLAYPHWWDYRIVANEAGLPPGRWRNGDIALLALPARIADGFFTPPGELLHLDPERDIVIMYPEEYREAAEQLHEWFPDGRETLIPTYKPTETLSVYRVPALGEQGIREFLRAQGFPVN